MRSDLPPKDICGEIVRLESMMRRLLYAAESLEQDIAFSKLALRIEFIVDYHQMARYAFPLSALHTTFADDIQTNTRRLHSVSLQIAREYCLARMSDYPLSGTRHANSSSRSQSANLLIPPYAAELEYGLLSLSRDVLARKIDVERAQEAIAKLIPRAEQQKLRAAFEQMTAEGPNASVAPTYEQLQVVFKHLGHLLFALSATTVPGLRRLSALLSLPRPRLEFLGTLYPEFNDALLSVAERPVTDSFWYDLFKTVRGRWDSDSVDAQAVEMALELNRRSSSSRCETLFLIYSDADSMYEVVNWDSNEHLNSEFRGDPRATQAVIPYGEPETGTRILRCSETLLLHILYADDDADVVLESLAELKQRIRSYLATLYPAKHIKENCRFYNKASGVFTLVDTADKACPACALRSDPSAALDCLLEFQRGSDEILESRLVLARHNFLAEAKNFEQRIALSSELRSVLDAFLAFLQSDAPAIDRSFRQRESELQPSISEAMTLLGERLLYMSEELTKESGNIIRKFLGIPYRLSYKRLDLRSLFDSLSKIEPVEPSVSDKLRPIISRLLAEARKPDPVHRESELLLASLFYGSGDYSLALGVLEDQIHTDPRPANLYEYLYLEALALWSLGMTKGVLGIVREAICRTKTLQEKNSSDPRGYFLEGRMIGGALDERGSGFPYSLTDAMRAFQHALELCSTTDEDLITSIENNVTYCVFLSGEYTVDNVKMASEHFQRVLARLGSARGRPTHHDTYACLKFMNARVAESPAAANSFLKEAVEHSNRAIELADTWGYSGADRKFIVRNNRRFIEALQASEAHG